MRSAPSFHIAVFLVACITDSQYRSRAAQEHDGVRLRPVSDQQVKRTRRPWLRLTGVLLPLGTALCLVLWGGRLLVATDPLPPRSDVLVVLAGSIRGEQVRRREAMRLLKEGRAERLVLSAPQVTYFGEWVPDLMRRHMERVYGLETARHVVLCPHTASSTREEAEALRPCLEGGGWRTVVVVTSNYHTRRAGHVWREVVEDANRPIQIFVHGVSDGDFEPRGWWRRRRYAKTFVQETTKLTWAYVFE